MSKAFTRESDDLPEEPVLPRAALSLPSGVKNYLTPDGAERLRAELGRLVQTERPGIAASTDLSTRRRELQIIDQRIAHLQLSLQSAVIVSLPDSPDGQVRFGATVTTRDKTGAEMRYRIVGVDEADFDRGWVSWRSPIARALANARVGQTIRFQIPSGDEELEILAVTYEPTPLPAGCKAPV